MSKFSMSLPLWAMIVISFVLLTKPVFSQLEVLSKLVDNSTKSLGFSIGDRVQATQNLTVRSTAGGTSVGTESSGGIGTIQAGPQYVALSGTGTYYYWYQVQWDDGKNGWSVQDYMIKIVLQPDLTQLAENTPKKESMMG